MYSLTSNSHGNMVLINYKSQLIANKTSSLESHQYLGRVLSNSGRTIIFQVFFWLIKLKGQYFHSQAHQVGLISYHSSSNNFRINDSVNK